MLQYQRELDEQEAHKLAMEGYNEESIASLPKPRMQPTEAPRPRYPGIPSAAEGAYDIPSEYQDMGGGAAARYERGAG